MNSSPLPPMESFPGNEIQKVIAEKYQDFQPTDQQFDLSRHNSVDIVNPQTERRLLISYALSENVAAELQISKSLGQLSVPRIISYERGVATYRLPMDAAPVFRLLRLGGPYGAAYMKRMASAVAEFMKSLHSLDPGLFGLSPEDIATYRVSRPESDDDAAYMIVPPISPPGRVAAKDLEELVRWAHQTLPRMISDNFADTIMGEKPSGAD